MQVALRAKIEAKAASSQAAEPRRPLTGRAIKGISQHAELYLSTPRAASFAVTFRIGLPQKQLGLPAMEHEIVLEPERIVDELFDCLDSFQRKDDDRLKQLIPDVTYRRNFVALAERLAPDGDKVKVVGFTVSRHGHERQSRS